MAGLTITASASFAHDVYAGLVGHGDAEPGDEIRVARITAVVIGTVAGIGGIYARRLGQVRPHAGAGTYRGRRGTRWSRLTRLRGAWG